ncbi:MAG: ribonuclease R, partial [Oscillospiraceae bacterium]|nr:ribonuclease R [Oscillospiraceae bacterium]
MRSKKNVGGRRRPGKPKQTVKPGKKNRQQKVGLALPPPGPDVSLPRDALLEGRVLVYLQHLQAGAPPCTPGELSHALDCPLAAAEAAADALWRQGALARTRQGAYAQPAALGLWMGAVQVTARGDAYLLPEGEPGERRALRMLCGALHGDTVWVYAMGARRGQVARVVRRAHETIVGVLLVDGRKAYLRPDDMRLPQRVPLFGDLLGAAPGELLAARVTRWDDEGGLRAQAQQRLGDVREARSGMLAITLQYGLQPDFDEACLHQAKEAAARDIEAEIPVRLDLRGARVFTIDAADAKDFDDAVSIEPVSAELTRLGVHIADVSWYVAPDTALDAQAAARATSVYLPGMVLPMLPEALSNGSCSLLPGRDRLAFSLMMDVDAQGGVRAYKLARSIIRSCERLVYADVNLLLAGDAAQVARYAHILPDLQRMAALSALIRRRRYEKGSLDFDLQETAVTVDAQGEPVDISPRFRGVSERMIEDFMLLANETVASHARRQGLPFLYRVHEAPAGEKLQAFSTFLQYVGLRIHGARTGVTPRALQAVLEEAE